MIMGFTKTLLTYYVHHIIGLYLKQCCSQTMEHIKTRVFMGFINQQR